MTRTRDIERAAHEAARWFVAGELRHQEKHDRTGSFDGFGVFEQQTGHEVCAWCGWCKGGCNQWNSSTSQNPTGGD